ncbi:MAG: SMC family ATPase [Melioribacteraceae bacterium]|nr:SMC family ATPase [Melioribacteraceae bacterium]
MRIIKLELRGAIGINKGLGIEEITIDFSCFQEGLIALVGENGRGKTTIIENLHPFRRLISREGNLSDHFYLKDSYRKLEFSFNGKIYRSEIYIDGITKKQEAYLKTDQLSLNDGKPTSYDEVLEEIFGSEELFFNSVFSAQKSRGISELSASQKRELFYELLGLNKYQLYLEKAKEFMKDSEIIREKILYQKSTSEESLLKLPRHEIEFIELTDNHNKVKHEISLIDISLSELKERKSDLEKMKIAYVQKSEINESLLKRIEELEKELSINSYKYNSKIESIKNEYSNQLPLLADFTLLKKESDEINLKIEELKKNDSSIFQTSEISALEKEREKLRLEITHLEKILKKENDVLELSLRQNELLDLVTKHKEEENYLINLHLEADKKEREEKEKLIPLYEELSEQKNNLADKSSKSDLINLEKENLERNSKQKIESMEEEISIIDRVPCDDNLGARCPLLNHAFISRSEIISVKVEYGEKLVNLSQLLHKNDLERSALTQNINDLLTKISLQELEISKAHAYRLGQITAQKDKLFTLKNSAEYELKSLKELNLLGQLEEINRAKTKILITDERIKRIEHSILSKQELIEKTKENDRSQLEALEEKLKNIENKIALDQQKIEEEKLKRKNEYESRISSIEKELEYKSEELLKWIAKEKANLDLTVDKMIAELTDKIEITEYKLNSTRKEKDQRVSTLTETEAKLIFFRQEIEKINKVKVDLELLERNLRQVEKNIIEYSFLIKAFDKTGIPVLKLENSGFQITSLANELLKNFKNDFRIAFETTRMTKDRKKTKEVFDINVIDQDGICELKNKSGGERIWIESSIQLALGILLRLQGKKLETSFLDEQDGALDYENAMSYRTMIEKAHGKAGLFNTIIISHRSELINLIDQKIILEEDGIYLKAS